MRDVAMPYRAVPERTKQSSDPFLWFCVLMTVLALMIVSFMARNKTDELEQRLAASEACLTNLHITMTRLDNPGPERGAVVASVGCGKGE